MRDALLDRHAEYLDLDFVLAEDAVGTAKAIAKHYQAGFVVLDAERQIARVVFDQATVDFALQVGQSLEEDLRRRDFTVNAIAYNPFTEQLVDPLQGYRDLQQGQIRMISRENLEEDPLRLLRAYRQAAQLGFCVDVTTREAIHQIANALTTVAAERVQAELSYLLSTAKGTPWLKMTWQDGLLNHWLPSATQAGLDAVRQVDEAAIALSQNWPEFGAELTNWMRDQQRASGTVRSWLKVAKLTRLVNPDLAIAEQELWRLKYSRAEVHAVLTVLKALPILPPNNAEPLSIRDRYRLFKQVGSVFPALMAVAVAKTVDLEVIAPLIEHFLSPDDPVAHPKPLLSGRDLMNALKLAPGPKVGELLAAIQLAQAEGFVKTAAEAIAFAHHLLDSPPGSEKSDVTHIHES